MNKRLPLILLSTSVVLGCSFGCGEKLPENTMAPDGKGHVSGSPQDRITAVENNPSLSAEEKARRIAAIKERNNLP